MSDSGSFLIVAALALQPLLPPAGELVAFLRCHLRLPDPAAQRRMDSLCGLFR